MYHWRWSLLAYSASMRQMPRISGVPTFSRLYVAGNALLRPSSIWSGSSPLRQAEAKLENSSTMVVRTEVDFRRAGLPACSR